jgi:hypothetical protein
LITTISPILQGESRTEAYITQPTLFGFTELPGGWLRVDAAVSLEALTLERGELGAGAYGEGYVDRRHPHTWLHELMVSGRTHAGPLALSLSAGRGFVPFGTDDPMMRPFVKFPVNHHLGQVLERLAAIAGVSAGPVTVEAALFNGNEPIDAEDMGSLDRFGDSWAARLTVSPADGLELQASHAWIESPELPIGGGWDQRKWSASARYERTHGRSALYGLAEWNRTAEVDRGTDVFTFGSVLLEAGASVGGWRPAIRIERAERPEEQRASNPFRTPWPHGGGHVLGITRWTNVAARLERSVMTTGLHVAPFIEASVANVTETAGGVFDPEEFYGGTHIGTLSIGARVRVAWHPRRMGRYGVAAPSGAETHDH